WPSWRLSHVRRQFPFANPVEITRPVEGLCLRLATQVRSAASRCDAVFRWNHAQGVTVMKRNTLTKRWLPVLVGVIALPMLVGTAQAADRGRGGDRDRDHQRGSGAHQRQV